VFKSSEHLKKVDFMQRRFFARRMSDTSELTASAVVFQLEAIKTAATALVKGCDISTASFYWSAPRFGV
jgi:hypothetical protein